jgi:NitT/TauT family transport system permease protein
MLKRNAIGWGSVLAFLVLWEVIVRVGVVDATFLPPPSLIFRTMWELIQTGVLLEETVATMQRIGVGFGLATLLGLTMAILCRVFETVDYATATLVELIRGIAPLALLPAFMLIFGIGFISKVAVIVWVAWIPIFLNTLQGMKSADPLLIKAARSMGSTKLQIAFKVILPAAAPFIVTGLRLAMGSAFLVLVAAEMLGENSGLGFYILDMSQTFEIPEMYAAIFMIGILGLLLNIAFLLVARILTPWTYTRE